MNHPIIEKTEVFVREALGRESTGHDWHHIERVRRSALHIWKQEQTGDPFIIEMAALLHDIPDDKLNKNGEEGKEKLNRFLNKLHLKEEAKNHIVAVIFSISYKGGNGSNLESVEAEIVQDADRLDAIGAIGIARTFAYGGKKGQPLYDPDIPVRGQMTVEEYRKGKSSTIHHFYEKLLKLQERLNTETARKMAEERHKFMEKFLHQFYSEWNGQS